MDILEKPGGNYEIHGDSLSFLMVIPKFFCSNTYGRFFLDLSFILSVTLFISAATIMAISMDIMFIVRYFLCIFGNFYAAYCIYVLISRDHIYHAMIKSYFPLFWSHTKITGPAFISVQNEIKSAKLMLWFILAQLVATSVLLMIPSKDDEDFLLPVIMLNTMLGHYGFYIALFFRIFVPPFAFSMIAPNLVLMYSIIHLRLQIQILNDRIRSIRDLQVEVKCSEELDDRIYNTLVNCVKHHLLLKKLCAFLNDLVYIPVLIFTSTGFLLCLVVLLFIYMRISPSSNIRVFSFIINILTMIFNFAFLGQSLIDESEKIFYSASSLPWYNWNIKNKKCLLMLLTNSMDYMEISTSGLITLSYQLLIKIYKATYSGFTFMMNIC